MTWPQAAAQAISPHLPTCWALFWKCHLPPNYSSSDGLSPPLHSPVLLQSLFQGQIQTWHPLQRLSASCFVHLRHLTCTLLRVIMVICSCLCLPWICWPFWGGRCMLYAFWKISQPLYMTGNVCGLKWLPCPQPKERSQLQDPQTFIHVPIYATAHY